jgi:signal transduction histidine kinase
MLGKGMMGGRLLNLPGHGAASAQMAVRILNGASPGSLAKFSPSPNQFMFDYNQMSRYGIGESQLPADSIVINRPPGFLRTYKVALLSAICGALVLALIGIFVKLLNSRKELSASLVELQEAQSQLLATARKAGMAEIATNVLHNVGNVLNSVNISAGVLSGVVRDSKALGLSRAVRLLKEHSLELGDYLTRDEKGKLLPGYLEKLSEALADERQGLLDELSQLTRSVDHIEEIVATQQYFAGASRLIEPVRVADLLDDALRINAEALERHKVTVVKEYAGVQVLPLDKARVLQILVNLISNAKYAMDGNECGPRRLTLKAELTGGSRLRLSVCDVGEGIAPDNLARIFSHGFTTRRRGHGFGLHSCALAAKEMGGTLTATSPGVGKGATFVLELPWEQPGEQFKNVGE